MKGLLVSLFLILSIPCSSQINVMKAGDGWDLKVDSALALIAQTDVNAYTRVINVCQVIDFWISPYSSNTISQDGGTIFIATGDIKTNSLNNLACVIVHESLHLYYLLHPVEQSQDEEELKCYIYELDFIKKLPTPEPWLQANAIEQLHKLTKTKTK
jgi:hypothetical protein